MENETEVVDVQPKEPQVSSVGKTSLLNRNEAVANQNTPQEEAKPENVDESKGKEAETENSPALTDEQRTAFFKELGIEYKGEEDLAKVKEKLNYTPPSAEPTEEEKAAAKAAEERDVLDLYLANGGKVEDFAGIKAIMNADVKELSLAQKTKELQDAGFDKDEADSIIKERYYQMQLDEMEWDEFNDTDETKEDFEKRKASIKKKVDYFSNKLDNSAAFAKTQAEQLYNNLKAVISERKAKEQKNIEHAANADKFIQNVPRETSFELGKLNDIDLAPVKHRYSDEEINAVAEIVKDTAKIEQFLFNEDGSYNLANLTDALLSQKAKNSIARTSLLEGQTRTTEVFRKQFPHSTPTELGVGGAPSKQGGIGKGQVASFGKTQRGR